MALEVTNVDLEYGPKPRGADASDEQPDAGGHEPRESASADDDIEV